jgi:hypothetical protein
MQQKQAACAVAVALCTRVQSLRRATHDHPLKQCRLWLLRKYCGAIKPFTLAAKERNGPNCTLTPLEIGVEETVWGSGVVRTRQIERCAQGDTLCNIYLCSLLQFVIILALNFGGVRVVLHFLFTNLEDKLNNPGLQ